MVKQMESAGQDEPADFGILLGLAFGAFASQLRASLAQKGHDNLHRSFGYVARNLAAAGSLTLTELATRLGITTPGALKIVQSMEDAGHIERIADPDDARAKRLRLTKKGKTALETARTFHAAFESALVIKHGEKKVAALRAILTEIVAAYEETEETKLFLRPM